MSQLTRGIAWRKGQAITLFLLGTVVVAGCLVAAQFSELTDTPAGSVGIILLLGVVALSVQAAASARSRRSEIALAQIRGRQGARLFAYFLTEPVTILVLATIAGVLLGRMVTELAADRWLDTSQDPAHIGGLGWASVALAAAASLGAVVAGSWRTVREPLVEQIDAGHRPRPAATLVLFGQTLVIVAAGIAAFQASQDAGSRDGWAGLVNPALLSPILLGLAAGQLAAWGIQGGRVRRHPPHRRPARDRPLPRRTPAGTPVRHRLRHPAGDRRGGGHCRHPQRHDGRRRLAGRDHPAQPRRPATVRRRRRRVGGVLRGPRGRSRRTVADGDRGRPRRLGALPPDVRGHGALGRRRRRTS